MKKVIILLLIISASQLCRAQNSLINTKWSVTSLYDKSLDTLISNRDQALETCELHFKTKTLLVNTCNEFTLSYKVQKNKILLSDYPPGLQAAFCGGGFSNAIEEYVYAKMKNPVTFEIKDNLLLIKTLDSSVITCTKMK